MDGYKSGVKGLDAFAHALRGDGRSRGTVEKYLRDAGAFFEWLGERELTGEAVTDWRDELLEKGYAPVTVNAMLSALNSYFKFSGRKDCVTRVLRVQRRLFKSSDRELTRRDYDRLIAEAKARGKRRLELSMETMASTGMRVSELRFVTVEALKKGRAEVHIKGKSRSVPLLKKLRKKLLAYCRSEGITTGAVFVTKSGRPVSRGQLWAEMKALCKAAGVKSTKVFPHNLRHLFAVAYYNMRNDIARLADVMGHSSIDTTRLYLLTTCEEQERQLDQLGFVT